MQVLHIVFLTILFWSLSTTLYELRSIYIKLNQVNENTVVDSFAIIKSILTTKANLGRQKILLVFILGTSKSTVILSETIFCRNAAGSWQRVEGVRLRKTGTDPNPISPIGINPIPVKNRMGHRRMMSQIIKPLNKVTSHV